MDLLTLLNRVADSRAEPQASEKARDDFVVALLPDIDRFAHDVFKVAGCRPTDDWLRELVQEGCTALVARLDTLLTKRLESDKHLRNSLRWPLKKAMARRLHRMYSVPLPTPKTRRARKERGEPEYRAWEYRQRVPLDEERRDRDPGRAARYWRLVYAIKAEARQRVTGRTWLAVEIMLARGLSLAEIARRAGMAESTLRDRLRALGREIAADAAPELRDLIEEFRPDCAVDFRLGGHRNYRRRKVA